jgi:hypothetical protein
MMIHDLRALLSCRGATDHRIFMLVNSASTLYVPLNGFEACSARVYCRYIAAVCRHTYV